MNLKTYLLSLIVLDTYSGLSNCLNNKNLKEKHNVRYSGVFFSIFKSSIQSLTCKSGSGKIYCQNIRDLHWPAIEVRQRSELNFPYKPVKS